MAKALSSDVNDVAKLITTPSKSKRKPKWLIYGRNKKGKTRFGLTVNEVPGEKILVMDPEHGTDAFKKRDPAVLHVARWEDMDRYVDFLAHGNHDFTWVMPDGLTRMANMAFQYVSGVKADRSLSEKPKVTDPRRTYGQAGELVKEMLVRLHNLDMGVIYTAQERQVEAQESEEDEDVEGMESWFVADLPKGARAMVNSLVDVIGRIYVVNVQLSSGRVVKQRRLWLGVSERYDTGYRSEYELPDMIKNPTAARLIEAIRTGKVQTKRKAS